MNVISWEKAGALDVVFTYELYIFMILKTINCLETKIELFTNTLGVDYTWIPFDSLLTNKFIYFVISQFEHCRYSLIYHVITSAHGHLLLLSSDSSKSAWISLHWFLGNFFWIHCETDCKSARWPTFNSFAFWSEWIASPRPVSFTRTHGRLVGCQ